MGDSVDEVRVNLRADQVKALKRNLEGWREVLLPLNSVLKWERKYDPAVLLSVITFIFSMLWYFEPSVLTTFSLLGIVICVIDYLVPTLCANFFDPEKWTGLKERKFDEICTSVVGLQDYFLHFQNSLNVLKETKPKIYFVTVLSALSFFAWVGNLMDNLLLTYFLFCLVTLLPGLQRHGILKKYLSRAVLAISKRIGGGGNNKKKN